MVLQIFYGCFFCSPKEKKYRGCTIDTLHKEPDLNQHELYCVLAEELIAIIYGGEGAREGPNMIRKIWDPHHMTRWILYLNYEQLELKKTQKMVPWQSSVSRGDVECVIKTVLPLYIRLVMITMVKSSISVIHELAEIALNCMSKKSIFKNKKCYLLLVKILYIIIVFKIYI